MLGTLERIQNTAAKWLKLENVACNKRSGELNLFYLWKQKLRWLAYSACSCVVNAGCRRALQSYRWKPNASQWLEATVKLFYFKFKYVFNNGEINYENKLPVEVCFLMVISSDLKTSTRTAWFSAVTGFITDVSRWDVKTCFGRTRGDDLVVPSGLVWVKDSIKYNCFCQLEMLPLKFEEQLKDDSEEWILAFSNMFVSLGAFYFIRCWVLGVWVLLEMPSLCHRHGNIQVRLFHHKSVLGHKGGRAFPLCSSSMSKWYCFGDKVSEVGVLFSKRFVFFSKGGLKF